MCVKSNTSGEIWQFPAYYDDWHSSYQLIDSQLPTVQRIEYLLGTKRVTNISLMSSNVRNCDPFTDKKYQRSVLDFIASLVGMCRVIISKWPSLSDSFFKSFSE